MIWFTSLNAKFTSPLVCRQFYSPSIRSIIQFNPFLPLVPPLEVLIQSSSGDLLRLSSSNRGDVRQNERLGRFGQLRFLGDGVESNAGGGEGVGEDVENVVETFEDDRVLLLNQSAKRVELQRGRQP